MIRFCDKEVYNVVQGEMTRTQMLLFFLENEEQRNSVIAVYDGDGKYQGIVTYHNLLEQEELSLCINKERIIISDRFWEEARAYFEMSSSLLLPVMDINSRILGFAFNDPQSYYFIDQKIKLMEKDFEKEYFSQKYRRIKLIVITDLNEVAWKCYLAFKKMGFEICVLGDKWEWFGLISGDKYLDYPEFAKLYIYAEGTDCIRVEDERKLIQNRTVHNAFRFLEELNNEIMQTVYVFILKSLVNKGISVCECIIPSRVNYRTELEKICSQKEASLEKYFDEAFKNKNDIKDCLFEMYGEKNILTIKKEGGLDIGGKGSFIPVGNFIGQTIQNGAYRKRIYVLGPCIAEGFCCIASDSLNGQLQKFVTKYEYQVVSVCIEIHRWDKWIEGIESIPVRKNDIILIIYDDSWFPKGNRDCSKVDLSHIYNNPERMSMFCRMPIHTNPEGNRAIAEEIFTSYLKKEIERLELKQSRGFLQKGELLNADAIAEIQEYVMQIKKYNCEKIGAIVMNCNPFTYGHRYLIEYAAMKMEKLYVFVVEEDRSFFKFSDRFEMVQEGTKDLVNVIVVPSGQWVLSYKTMPVYFEKENKQDIKIDAYLDLEIFGRYIAPPLGIQRRFVGEEPFDKVTRQYNEQMAVLLKDYDIELEEIPRKMYNGRIISASYVRNCMKNAKWEELRNIIPEISYQICRKYEDRI